MILFLHGFASSGSATKATALKEFVNGKTKFISPDLPAEPFKAIELIDGLLKNADEDSIVFGSSLGGFYALYAGIKHNTRIVLINPAVEPHIDLKSVVGINTNYQTGEQFEFKQEYVEQLFEIYKKIDLQNLKREKLVLMLAEDDDLLDYKRAMKYFKGEFGKLIFEKEAGHSFTKFAENLNSVFNYFK